MNCSINQQPLETCKIFFFKAKCTCRKKLARNCIKNVWFARFPFPNNEVLVLAVWEHMTSIKWHIKLGQMSNSQNVFSKCHHFAT